MCAARTRPEAPWETIDWDTDPDWDMHSAADGSAEEYFAQWEQAVKGDLG